MESKKTSCLWHIWHCSNTEQHAFTQTHWVYSSSLVHIPTPPTIQVLSSRSIVYIIVTQSFYASITSYLKKSVSSDYEVFGSISVFADADICMISQWTCLIHSFLISTYNFGQRKKFFTIENYLLVRNFSKNAGFHLFYPLQSFWAK